MRFILGIAVVATLTMSMGCSIPRHRSERTVREQLETSPLNKIDVSTFNGPITIQSHALPTVDMEVTYAAYGETPEDAAAACAQLDTDISAENGQLKLVATKPSGQWSASVSYRLMVPSNCEVILKSSNGKVSIDGIQGNINVETSNGTIAIKNVASRIVARTSNGTITASGFVGPIDLKTSNGRVEIDGQVVGMSNRIRTSNGRVTVKLPSGAASEIDVSTSNGKIQCDLPMHTIMSQKKRSLHALVGPDGSTPESKLSVSSSNGSITVSESDLPGAVLDEETELEKEAVVDATAGHASGDKSPEPAAEGEFELNSEIKL